MLLALSALLLFQIKHFFGDFVFQPYKMVIKKGIYLHPAGLLHAGIHAVGSVPAVLLMTRSPAAIGLVLGAEFLVHYHCDWSKAKLDELLHLSNRSTLHWVIFGFDQFVHQLTYLAMVYLILARI